jgi:hypothetical protein
MEEIKCTSSLKPLMPLSSKKLNREDRKPLQLSSKMQPQSKPSLTGSISISKQLHQKNSDEHLKTVSLGESSQTKRVLIETPESELMKIGSPGDACGRCGCKRKSHKNKETFSYSKSGGSSGRSVELPITARTSCDCHFCICFCVAFIEPFKGQPYTRCVYEPN